MGNAKFATSEVDHSRGVCGLIPQDGLAVFLPTSSDNNHFFESVATFSDGEFFGGMLTDEKPVPESFDWTINSESF